MKHSVLALILIFALLVVTAPQVRAETNGIVTPGAGATVSGVVSIVGIADRPDFAKWQLDLLPGGSAEQASFLALGETPLASPSMLAALDTTRVANGPYALRLRVVRRDGNYDEYLSAITVANPLRPSPPLLAPTGSLPTTIGVARPRSWAARLDLPAYTDEGKPIFYLTFDDGPSPALTPGVLQLLAQYDAKATFFVVGLHVRRAPDVLRPVVEAGHVVANHTFWHKQLVGRDRDFFATELQATEDIVQQAAGDLLPPGYRMSFLRPPGGVYDDNTQPFAAELGYQVANWDIDPRDWRRPSADYIAAHVIDQAFPGAIVVLHDGGGAGQQTAIALAAILEQLSQQGYVFRSFPVGDASSSALGSSHNQ